MKHKPYLKYKPSGVEWLGNIPESWCTDRLKWTIRVCQNGIWGEEPDGINDVVCIRVADFDRERFKVNLIEPTLRSIPASQLRGRLLHKGDILLEKSGGGEKQPVGAVVMFDHDCKAVCSNFISLISNAKNINSAFLTYLHAALYDAKINVRSIKQTTGIQNLDSSSYFNESVPYLSFEEQEAIADFLDEKCGRIDELIKKKEWLIEILKVKRTAIISHAVIRGLDPNVKMKNSGVEWLSDMPEHWDALPLKRIVAVPVTDGPHETPEILDDGIPFVSAESIRNNRIDFERKRGFISVEDHCRYSKKYKPKRDDIFMIKSGATTGNLAIVETDEEFNIWSPLAVVRANINRALPKYILFAMNSKEFQASVQLFWSYGTQQNIGMNIIENLPIPLPPLPEQRAIANHLDQETGKIDNLISKVEGAIEKLKEYRSGIITAAVTGKIDVRE